MSAPLSVKERIALMKQKEEEEKASKATPPQPPIRRSSISDRMAFKEKNEVDGSDATITSSSLVANETTSACPDAARVEKLGSSSDAVNATPTVGERMAALRRKSVGPTDFPAPPPPVPSISASATNPSTEDMPKSSIADRMAALRAASGPVSTAESKAPLFRIPSVTANSPPPPPQAQSVVAVGVTPSEDSASPPKMTIAERMAALKASAESQSTPTDTAPGPSGVTPLSTGGRRVSIGLVGLGAKINLAALSPHAVRPPIKREIEAEAEPEEVVKTTVGEESSPKSNRVSFSAQEDGEFKHLSLSRPAVHSIRRKNTTASVRLSSSSWQLSDDLPDGLSVISTSPRTPSTASANSSRPVSLTTGTVLSPVIDDGEEDAEAESPIVAELPAVTAPPSPPPRRPSVMVGAPAPPPPPSNDVLSATVSVPAPPPPPPITAASVESAPSNAAPPPPPSVKAVPEATDLPGVISPPPPPPRRPSMVVGAPPPPPPPLAGLFASVKEEVSGSDDVVSVTSNPPPPPPPLLAGAVVAEEETEEVRDEEEDSTCVSPSKRDPRFALL